MHQFDGLALRGDDVKPAAGDHHAGRKAEHAVGNGITMMMIVEQPAFVAAVTERSLDFRKIHA
jgi:hypothetical protein